MSSCTSVGSASRTENAECGAEDRSSASQQSETSNLLPGPFSQLSSSSDLGAQLAALLVKSAYDQKEGARAARDISERAQAAAEDKQLKEMKSEADSNLVAGLMESGTEIAGGAMNVGGACASTQATASGLAGSAEVVKGVGKFDSAMAKHDAGMAQEAGKAQEQIASRAKRSVDDDRDMDKDAKELLDRALGYYKEYLTAKAETQRATLLKA